MLKAIDVSTKALDQNEVPVGCIILNNDNLTIISQAYNQTVKTNSCLDHAEIIAIGNACQKEQQWRFNRCSIFVTMEPCLMCFGAIVNARFSNLYIGLMNEKTGFFSRYNLDLTKFKVNVKFNFLPEKSHKNLKNFFTNLRNENENT